MPSSRKSSLPRCSYISLTRTLEGRWQDEWLEGLNLLRNIGKKCEERGNLSEFVLFSDVFGVSSLVENIAHRKPQAATTSTVLGPFHVAGAPTVEDGANIAHHAEQHPDSEPMLVHGTVTDCDGAPIAVALGVCVGV